MSETPDKNKRRAVGFGRDIFFFFEFFKTNSSTKNKKEREKERKVFGFPHKMSSWMTLEPLPGFQRS